MMDVVKMGCLYLDGAPAVCGTEVDGQTLKIGNTHTGNELSWVRANGLLVADHVVCTSISWEDLDSQGFIFGVPVQIDGVPYLCRSLKVGSEEGIPNEWDTIWDATSEDDSLWHWEGIYFWGQEILKEHAAFRAIRGCDSARYWNDSTAAFRYMDVGFRPVLEPMIPATLISEPLIGKFFKMYGPDGKITGTLTGMSSYDLFLSPAVDAAPIPKCNWCCQQPNGTVIVARTATVVAKEI